MSRRFQWTTTAIASLAALVLVVAASAGTARGPKLSLAWQAPTAPDGTAFTVTAGEPFTLELAAASNRPQLVLIGKRKLPAGAAFKAGYGSPGIATVAWTPTAKQVGEHVMTFGARTHDLPYVYARPRSFLVYVLPSTPSGPNEPFSLSGPNGMSRWAHIDRKVAARSRPSASAKVITRLSAAHSRADSQPHAHASTGRSTSRASTGCGSACRSCRTARPAGCRETLSGRSARTGRGS